MGFSGREASWTAVVLYRFSLERAEAEDKDSRAARSARAAKAPEVWRSPRPGGLATSARRSAADGGPSAVRLSTNDASIQQSLQAAISARNYEAEQAAIKAKEAKEAAAAKAAARRRRY